MRLDVSTGREAVLLLAKGVLAKGEAVAPDGQETRELTNLHLTVAHPADTLCDGIGREGYLPELAAAEALHLISGEPYGATIHAITAGLGSQRWWWGRPELSYGVRARRELAFAVLELDRDMATRRAHVSFTRELDAEHQRQSYFCATGTQFLRRRGRLDQIVTMRSNDVWHGLPYNLFAFGQLQATLARVLGDELGELHLNIGSLHLYERHFELADRLHLYERHFEPGNPVEGVGRFGRLDGAPPTQAWGMARIAAARLLDGRHSELTTADEDWYAAVLQEFTQGP